MIEEGWGDSRRVSELINVGLIVVHGARGYGVAGYGNGVGEDGLPGD